VSAAPEAGPNAAPRRREWLPRAAFEATLILLGLLGAFALDEWQDGRSRTARVDALMAAVRAELDANLETQEEAAAYNAEVAESIWKQATSGVTFIPDGTFSRGIIDIRQLTSAAWTTAQNDSSLSNIPVDRLLLLANVYDMQADYEVDVSTLLNNMYASILQADSVMRIDGVSEPLRIGGLLRDNARRGTRLVTAYRATLEQLDATAPLP
jgi:hypothetical protein